MSAIEAHKTSLIIVEEAKIIKQSQQDGKLSRALHCIQIQSGYHVIMRFLTKEIKIDPVQATEVK